ncbi:hypothetical protein HELRODRAFT_184006 [Helobdella robusta]|uniref:Large ribosomal subunit protein mL64 n=1 Tax=Helobdella robusta TaxID=6412 RepID=T1FKE7_HELRO|nr:hypothetical protein HELRODRAFT_184006 [Helobdella robusta]ESO09645.1 hypothetical protein HELRODRAFT_184006 [Helobdella robusta]
MNVSRMPKRYRDRMLHVLTPDPNEVKPDYITAMYQKPALKKLLYAWYGKKSGINPGILWPSVEELKDIIEFEKEWEPSLQDMLAKLREERELEMKEIKEKEKLVESRLAKMPQYIKEYRARLKKAEEQELQLKKKRQVLLDEARDYFGYQIDPNDPRFEQIKLAKEEEEKKMMKKKKKEEKLSNVAKFTGSPH